jgi:hypothetical protein
MGRRALQNHNAQGTPKLEPDELLGKTCLANGILDAKIHAAREPLLALNFQNFPPTANIAADARGPLLRRR